ncbi:hypothetical protein PMAYCL1PPCAC_28073 [Pristionchus mayeri]|uniref:Amidase domain-containing protein n=1 Tax=Pristionchus mayeri TaxID=1317129 RepID=A0AAN5D7C8_9BILA|nr:hypothetical protein PMAYCL1PPCAC_28073 [Pristionchus mayeri]
MGVKDAVYTLASVKSTKYSVLGLITLYLLRQLRARAVRNRKQSLAAAKIAEVVKEREENIEWTRKEAEKISDEERKKIEQMDFTRLREALQSGAVTAESVMRVYYGRAVRAHASTNCLTNIIRQSLTDAQELDKKALYPSYKKPRLFGMPISVKESNEIEGQRCTWGLVQMIDRIPKEDGYLLMKLRMEGMIPFCQTNVPTTLMTYTCDNYIYGTTSNPHSSSRTSGGSSGGEGALIGAGGSLVGLGSDTAGSIRTPSAYSGCSGFKPSATRCSTLQYHEPVPLRPFCMHTEGPLAQDPYAIVEIMRSAWSDNFISNQDALTVPVDFREELYKEGRKFRIGFYSSDGLIDPLPGNQRVINEAVELLKARGHELVPFSLGDIVQETARGLYGTVFADGGQGIAEALRNEPLSDLMEPLRAVVSTHIYMKKLFGWICRYRDDQAMSDFFLSQTTKAIDIQTAIDRIYASRKRLVQKMKDERIDLLLCPSTISPAVPHALPTQIPFTAVMSVMFWNAMDFPAGVVTTGTWTEADEAALEAYPEKGTIEKSVKEACKESVGLPLSVQLVAPSFRDEMVLRAMVDLFEEVKEKRAL